MVQGELFCCHPASGFFLPHGYVWSQARKKRVPGLGGTSYRGCKHYYGKHFITGTDREKAFVGALFLGMLDPGGVGFADPGHGPSPLHTSAPEGLACGSKSWGLC